MQSTAHTDAVADAVVAMILAAAKPAVTDTDITDTVNAVDETGPVTEAVVNDTVAAAVEADRQAVEAAHKVAAIAAHPSKGALDIWAAARKALPKANTAVQAWRQAEKAVASHTAGSCEWVDPVLPSAQPSGAMSLAAAQLQQVVKEARMSGKRHSQRRIAYTAPADTNSRASNLGCPLNSCVAHGPVRETATR